MKGYMATIERESLKNHDRILKNTPGHMPGATHSGILKQKIFERS